MLVLLGRNPMTFRRLPVVLIALVAVAGAAFAADGDWPMIRYDEAQCGYTGQKLSPPLSLSWQYNGSKFDNNPSSPAVVGGVAYYASGDRVYAVDSKTGELKWRYPSADGLKSAIKTGLTVWGDSVIFGATDGNVCALDRNTGRLAWAFATQRPVRSTPIVSNGIVYVGSDDNSVYAIDAKSGEQVWSGPFKVNDDVHTPVALAAGTVIFSCMDANVYGANEASGRMRWVYQLPMSAIKCGPVVSNNTVYIAASRAIHALSAKTGQFRYRINLDSDVAAQIALAGSDIYVVTRNRKLYAYTVSIAGYKMKWAEPATIGVPTSAPPTVAGDVIYVGSAKGMISAYATEDGKLLWRQTIAPSIIGNNNKLVPFTSISAPMVVADGALYVVADDGTLSCFRPSMPDQTAPRIYNVNPPSGVPMNGFPPLTVSAILYDETSGIDPNTIQVLLDNEKKDYVYDPSTLLLYWSMPITQPLTKLSDGRHTLAIKAKDWKGNELNYTWNIAIDNSLPQRPMPKSKAPTSKTPKQPTGTSRTGRTGTTGNVTPPTDTGPPPPPVTDGPPPPMPGMP
jgi:outer membrane protein assembly factor BamB